MEDLAGNLDAQAQTIHTRCCIVGGGPAGMMLGLLLARGGVEVVILEKHADFLRDFRGDTVHPSTLEVMYELGLLEDFLKRPHQKVREVSVRIAGVQVVVADFSRLPTRAGFIAFMPQWDFLDFLAEQGRRLASFHLRMSSEVVDLIHEGDRLVGVRVATSGGTLEVRCDLIIGADGRKSIVREKAGLAIREFGAPIDVLWMRISRRPDDPGQILGFFDRGRVLGLFERGDYWQCGLVIPKGGFDGLRERGIAALRAEIGAAIPFLGDRLGGLRDWDDVKLLTVRVDRLRRWFRPGLLCIGDAAHAMSPVGGVGINLAIQDAVATANILREPLHRRARLDPYLRRVQRRRQLPVRLTQWLQIMIQKRLLRSSRNDAWPRPPLLVRLFGACPQLRRLPGRLVGLGFRPEHVANAIRRAAPHECPRSTGGG